MFLFRGGVLLAIACVIAALLPGVRSMDRPADEGGTVSVGGATGPGRLADPYSENDDRPLRVGSAMASQLRLQPRNGGTSAIGEYAELLAANTAAPPCGRGPRLGRCGARIAVARPRQDVSSSRIAHYATERPVSYAVALLSQTLEADRCPEYDGRGRPATLPRSIPKGPFGGAAAAHARL